MALDRGRLANIDRRLFSELSHDAGTQTVKVPVSDAAWSTWRRYCDVLGLTMGEGDRCAHRAANWLQSRTTLSDGSAAVLAIRAAEQLAARGGRARCSGTRCRGGREEAADWGRASSQEGG